MKRFELRFIGGLGDGRSIEVDEGPPLVVWLCRANGKRWWAVKRPDVHFVEQTYDIKHHILLKNERYKIMYTLRDEL